MASFITFDPKLPPITRIISLSSLKPQISFPFSFEPVKISFLIGLPVNTPLLFLTNCKLSLKVTHNLSQKGDANLFASPGVISDSCATTGIFFIDAAITTGTVTNPPFENITSGFSFDKILIASQTPFNTLKGSVKFFISKYLLSLPDEIP